jgi:hypothetical protein
MRFIAALVLSVITGTLQAQSLSPNAGKLYAVIFDVTVDSAGVVETLKVAKVIDPSSGSTNSVDVAVPATYVNAARAFLAKRKYGSDPRHFNTWLFYDPSRPTRADIDPKSGRP